VGGFKEGQEGRPPPNSPPNKFQGKTSGTSRMLENLLAVSSGPAGGPYSAPSQTPQLVGEDWLSPLSALLGIGLCPFGLAPNPK